MKLSTGKVAFPIEFDTGDKDCIYFNPSDPNLAIRLAEFQDRASERMKEIEDLKLTNDGMPEDVALIEAFKERQSIFCSELDIAFGGEVSSVVFKRLSPFAIVNGEFFLMHFINAITPEIEKHVKKANADAEKRMQKHIAKYKK